jgi:phage-related protein
MNVISFSREDSKDMLTQKTPRREIETALRRAKEVK